MYTSCHVYFPSKAVAPEMTMHRANPGCFPRSRPALPRNFLVVGRGQAFPPQASHTDAKLRRCALAYDTCKFPAAESKVGDDKIREGC